MIGSVSAGLRLLLFVLVTLPLMPAQLLFLAFWPRMAIRFPHYYHRLLCRILSFDLRISGTLPATGQCLLVCNHVSWIDVVVLSAVAPVSFVAKHEVAAWPVFGWLAKLQRTIFVNRMRRHSSGTSTQEISVRLAAGERIVLFPEGTSHDGERVLPFKSTFFAAASDTAIQVVPVTLVYASQHGLPLTRRNRALFSWYGDMELIPHLWGALKAVPLVVDVILHDPLDQETARDRKRAARQSEALVGQCLALALHGPAKVE